MKLAKSLLFVILTLSSTSSAVPLIPTSSPTSSSSSSSSSISSSSTTTATFAKFELEFCALDCAGAVDSLTASGSVDGVIQIAAEIPDGEVTSTVDASSCSALCSDIGNRRLQAQGGGIVKLNIEILLPQQLATSPEEIQENLVAYGLMELVNEILGNNAVIGEPTLELISTSPTSAPTSSPTSAPTTSPTKSPTTSPTKSPTTSPTKSPTTSPTKSPTTSPTSAPINSPTKAPTTSPTSPKEGKKKNKKQKKAKTKKGNEKTKI